MKEFIDRLIDKYYIDESGLNDPIYDGIINEEEFAIAPIKLLWILKEPYDNPGGEGGGWDKREDLKRKSLPSDFGGDRSTFEPMIYCSYCILNGFIPYSDPKINYINEDPGMIKVLDKIAYINISKLPANTRSSGRDGFLSEIYSKAKVILFSQLSHINPDVIIGGNTLSYFWDDLDIKREELNRYDFIEYVDFGGKLFINTYHPAQTTVTRDVYCDSLIEIVKKWYFNKK